MFHITPNGVRPCEAYERSCTYQKYSPHFETEAEAVVAEQKIKRFRERESRQLDLQNRLDQKRPEDVYQGYIEFNDDDALRSFGEKVEGTHRIGYVMHTASEMDNGAFSPVEMTLERRNLLDPETEQVEGLWIFHTRIENDESNDFAETTEKVEFRFKDDMSAEDNFKRLHRAIKRNAYRSGLDPEVEEEDIEQQTEQHFQHFKNVIDSVENESSNPFRAWERGVGFFENSDPEAIRVDVDFTRSSFRGEHVQQFLQDNPLYMLSTPDVDIRVSEYDEDGRGWELNTADGYWWLKLTDENGYTVEEDILEEDEAYYRMRKASDDILGRHERESERHAEFAASLMREVNAAVREHPERIREYWAQEQKFREHREHQFVHGVLNKEEDRESKIDKIFNLFKN